MQWRSTILVAVTLTTCSGTRPFQRFVRADGTGIVRIVASTEAARRGDLEMREAGMRVLVAGPDGAPIDHAEPGWIRAASFATRDLRAPLGPVGMQLRADGESLRIVRGTIGPIDDGGSLKVRWHGEMSTTRGILVDVTRDYSIDSARHALVLETRIERVSPGAPIVVSAGIELRATSGSLFAPAHGLVTESGSFEVPWLALVANDRGWVATSPDGSLRTAIEVDSDTDGEPARAMIESNARPLAAGASIAFTTLLLGADGDLADLARIASTARGTPGIDVPMRVTAHDVIERSFVVVTRLDGAIMLVADMDGDRVRDIPLPAGEYLAYAFAHGHTTSEAIRFDTATRSEALTLAIPEGGRLHLVVRDRTTHAPLPARLVVRGAHGTPDPLLGPLHAAAGAGHVFVTVDGRADFAIPAGEYDVVASHGPEWSIDRAHLRVTPTERGEATLQLEHVVPMNDWTACDLHVHSQPSGDSLVAPVDRVASLVAEGIEFAAATEHNIVGDYGAGVAALPSETRDNGSLLWVPAVEVTTDPAPHPIGHFNVYPFPSDGTERGGPPPFERSASAIFAAARARQADGVIQVNHPRMEPGIGYFDRVGLDVRTNTATSVLYDPHYDAIEIFNGFFLSAPREVDRVMHDWFALLSTGARYIGTANSDSHEIAYHGAGYPRTYAYTPSTTSRALEPSDVIAAVHAGHVFGSSGPLLFARIGDAMPGDTTRAIDGHVDLDIEVRAAPWITVDTVDIYRNGELVSEIPIATREGATRFHRTVSLSIPDAPARSFVVVTTRGPQGSMEAVLPHLDAVPFAFTNPIWIDASAPRATATRRRRTRPAPPRRGS